MATAAQEAHEARVIDIAKTEEMKRLDDDNTKLRSELATVKAFRGKVDFAMRLTWQLAAIALAGTGAAALVHRIVQWGWSR